VSEEGLIRGMSRGRVEERKLWTWGRGVYEEQLGIMSEKPWCRRLGGGVGREEASLRKSQLIKRHSVSIHHQSSVKSLSTSGSTLGKRSRLSRGAARAGLCAGRQLLALKSLQLVRYCLSMHLVQRVVLISIRLGDGRTASVVGAAEPESSRNQRDSCPYA